MKRSLVFSLWLLVSVNQLGAAADLSGSYAWKPVKIGAGGFMRGMAVHPANSAVRYARGDVDNIYRWDNANSVWKPMKVSSALPSNVTAAPTAAGGGAIAVDPSNANVVLCAYTFHRSADLQGTNPDIPLNVYRSTDSGLTFTAGNLSLSGDDLSDETRGERMKIDPNNSNVVYLGSKTHGLWRSMDGGLTWSNVTTNGAPSAASNAVIPWIDKGGGTISFGGQTVSKRLYILMDYGPVLQSDDGGNSWTNVSDSEYVGKNIIASTLDQNGNLYVGDIPNYGTIAKRTRAGVWSTTQPPNGITGIAVDPNNANRVFVIGQGGSGLGRSLDGGLTWTRLGAAANYSTTQEIQWLRPSAIRPNGHFESTAGLYMDPSGRLWVTGGNDGIMTFMPNDAVDSDANPPIWSSNSQGIEEMVGHAVTIPPGGNPTIMFEDESLFTILNPDMFTAQHLPIDMWTNNTGLSEGQDIAYCPNQPHFMVETSDNAFYGREPTSTQRYSGYSTDGGATWNKFASIANQMQPCPLYCGLIAVAPRASGHLNDPPGADNIVWAPSDVGPGALQGITAAPFYSTDGGAHWTQTTSFNGTNGASTQNKCGINYTYLGYHCGPWTNLLHQHLLEADPLTPGTFYFQPTNLGFWKSTDGGVTWVRQAATGLTDQTHQALLRANPNVSGDLWFVDGYEGASAHGLWHTTDGGASFTKSTAFDYAWQLALGKPGAQGGYPAIYVYGKLAGDPNWGIFRSTDQAVTWDRISFYPYGIIDPPGGMAASWDTFGQVTISFQGDSAYYGTPAGPVPPAPTGLTASPGNTQVALSWTASTGATSYSVSRSTVSGNGYGYASVATGITATNYTNTGLINGTTYYYVVFAANSTGTSAASAEAAATPHPPIPTAPTGLTAAAASMQVTLAWTASTGATGYNVKRSTASGGPYAVVGSPTAATFTSSGLTNGTAYYFVVSAVNASGESANSAQVSATPGIHPYDFNGDGWPDLTLQNDTSSQITIWFMNNALVLAAQTVSLTPGPGWKVVGEGDFNGDGKTDLVLQSGSASKAAIWFMSGTSVVSGQYISNSIPSGWTIACVGDINNDGKPDLLLQNTSTNQVAFWYMNGATVIGGAYASAIPASGWKVVGAGDFNGDGKTDMALQNTSSRQIAFWFMNGGALLGGQYLSAIPASGWLAAGIGDFNRDGKPDLVLQNTSSNQVALWYLNGANVVGGSYASSTPSLGLHVVGPR